MKFVKSIGIYLFFIFLLLNLLGSKIAWACDYSNCQRGSGWNCGQSGCQDCPGCPTPRPTYSPPEPTETPEDITGKITNPALSERLNKITGVGFLGRFLRTGVNFGFLIGAVVFFFLLLTGAIKWIASGSDKVQLEGSQKQITHALVGLVILLSIFAIISLIESIFGISITKISLPIL